MKETQSKSDIAYKTLIDKIQIIHESGQVAVPDIDLDALNSVVETEFNNWFRSVNSIKQQAFMDMLTTSINKD
mgnify:CR=1 FL=1